MTEEEIRNQSEKTLKQYHELFGCEPSFFEMFRYGVLWRQEQDGQTKHPDYNVLAEKFSEVLKSYSKEDIEKWYKENCHPQSEQTKPEKTAEDFNDSTWDLDKQLSIRNSFVGKTGEEYNLGWHTGFISAMIISRSQDNSSALRDALKYCKEYLMGTEYQHSSMMDKIEAALNNTDQSKTDKI